MYNSSMITLQSYSYEWNTHATLVKLGILKEQADLQVRTRAIPGLTSSVVQAAPIKPRLP